MDPITMGLYGVLFPALAAGLVLAVGWRVWNAAPEGIDGRWAGAPALALSFLVGTVGISGLPVVPGGDQTPTGLDWLAWVALLAGAVLALQPRLGRWGGALRGVLAILTIELVLRNKITAAWSEGSEGIQWVLGLLALLFVDWLALERLARRPGASGPLVLWLLAATLGGLAALSGSVTIGQLSGALAAGLGAAVVAAWWRPRLCLAGPGVGVAVIVLFGLGLNAHFFSYTTGTDVLLFAAAPLFGLLAGLPKLRRSSGWAQTLLTVTLVALPIAVALTRAVLAYESDPYAGYYDY